MKKPLITIGITSFNSAKTLNRAVKSALYQYWRPIEIIIVDDFSTDNGYKILEKMADNFPEIRVFRNSKNEGVAFSRNKIISKAKGEFIAFFDDDDESLPNRLDQQFLRIVEYEKDFANNKLVICHCARNIHYGNNKVIYENTIGENTGNEAPNGIQVARRILVGKPLKNCYGSLATCSQMARLESYKLLDGFDVFFKRSEDTELNIRFAKKGAHFVGIKEALVNQYMTKTKDKKFTDEIFYFKSLIKKHKNLISKHQLDFALLWLDLKNLYFEGQFMKVLKLFSFCFLHYPIYSFLRFFLGMRNVTKNIYYFKFHKNNFKDL